jgi:radical SAM superfamily enzyme YgiQ (UPF0313 family)
MNEISRQTVCLVSPPSRASSPVLPLSLMYLDAWLKRKGIECRIVDIKRGKPGVSLSPSERRETVSEIVSAVADSRPAWVGVTCFTPEFEEVIALSRRIKQRVSTRIVAGGVHATVRPGDFFYEDRCVDFVIRGDGQEPLAKLVAARDDGITKERIEGVSYADSRGTAMDGGIAVFDEWDLMPLPDYGQLDMAYYVRPHRRVVRSLPASGLHVFTAFGCPFSCTFCANRKRKIRNRPISRVLDELEHLKKHYRIDAFYVLDDTFCLDKRRVRELTGGLKSRGLGFFWAAETRAGLVSAQ